MSTSNDLSTFQRSKVFNKSYKNRLESSVDRLPRAIIVRLTHSNTSADIENHFVGVAVKERWGG